MEYVRVQDLKKMLRIELLTATLHSGKKFLLVILTLECIKFDAILILHENQNVYFL